MQAIFKSTVIEDLAYVCRADGKCLITKKTRNRCQFCRFNKCLKLGMKRDLVQAGKSLVTPKAEPEDSLNCELCGEVLQDTDAFMRHFYTEHGHQYQVVGCEFFFTHATRTFSLQGEDGQYYVMLEMIQLRDDHLGITRI